MAKLDANRINSDHCLRLHANVIPCPHADCEKKFGLLSCLTRHIEKRHQGQGGVETTKRRWEDEKMSLRREQPDLERVFTKILEARSAQILRGLVEECVRELSMIRAGQQNTCNTGEGSSGVQLPPASPLRPGPSAHNASLPDPTQPTASANTRGGQGIEVGNAGLGNAVGVPIQQGRSNLVQFSPASADARNGQDIEMGDTEMEDAMWDGVDFGSPSPPNILYAGAQFNMTDIEQPTVQPAELELDGEFDRRFNDLDSQFALTQYCFTLANLRDRRRAIEQHPRLMLDMYRCIHENRDVFPEEDWENRFQ